MYAHCRFIRLLRGSHEQKQASILEAADLEKVALEKGRERYEERRITTTQLTTFNVHHKVITEALGLVSKALKKL